MIGRAVEPAVRTFPAGRPVGVAPGRVLVVLSGVVRVEAVHDDGTASIAGFAGPGEAVVCHRDGVFQLDYVAQTDVTAAVHELDQENPVEAALARRLAEMETWLAMLSERGVAGRLRAFRRLLAHGSAERRAALCRLTQEELGAVTLSSRASVARALRRERARERG